MKKILFLGVVCFAIASFCALPVLNAADAPADGLKMEATKQPVTFNHSTHGDYECKDCHHQWDGSSAIKKCSDAGCHDNFDRKAKGPDSYYQAMHNRRVKDVQSCISCHGDVAGKDREMKRELTGCRKSACHP